jgi:hypothetical protein
MIEDYRLLHRVVIEDKKEKGEVELSNDIIEKAENMIGFTPSVIGRQLDSFDRGFRIAIYEHDSITT